MLNSLRFKKDYRVFKKGQSFSFKPGLNVLVGDQGAGKSTVLSLLSKADTNVLDLETDTPTYSAYLDLEKSNPRNSGKKIEHRWQAAAQFSSHGETNKALLKSVSRMSSSTIILIDEPDMALSIRSIYNLFELLTSIPNQIICSVHNPIMIELAKDVLSLEHGRWMSSEEFIDSQINE